MLGNRDFNCWPRRHMARRIRQGGTARNAIPSGVTRDHVGQIMETLRIVKKKDEHAHGQYRTKDMILGIYDQISEAIRTRATYQTRLDPPPGPPADEAGNFIPMAQWDPDNWPNHIHPPAETNR